MNKDIDPGNFIEIKGASQHNLKNIDLKVPRNQIVVFTGISGSGKSSLAFGTLYAEAQRRYFESVAPYARRLIEQIGAPKIKKMTGMPPAIALHQNRGGSSYRSTVGTITTLSNSLRMLFSRAGTYPAGTLERLDSDAFSQNTPQGACPHCHGTGFVMETTEDLLVPNPELSIAEKAIAAWPGAWLGKNFRDILDHLGYPINRPWKELKKEDRDWILFTEEQPVVTIHPIRDPGRIQRDYQGTYMSARKYLLHTYYHTQSENQRKRIQSFLQKTQCPLCHGEKLSQQALNITFRDHNIAYFSKLPLEDLSALLKNLIEQTPVVSTKKLTESAFTQTALKLSQELYERIEELLKLGLGYLSMNRGTDTLSQGEIQRLKLATQLKSGLFGIAYVLDEPSAGLHPSDTQALLEVLKDLKLNGNTLLLVEHNLKVIQTADWIVDIGPKAGKDGGKLLYSGPIEGLRQVKESFTRPYLFHQNPVQTKPPRQIKNWAEINHIEKNNLHDFCFRFALNALTAITGVSGSGKSTLVSQVIPEILGSKLSGLKTPDVEIKGCDSIKKITIVDQKPIGRTPRSNMATYTGFFDLIRNLYSEQAQKEGLNYEAGRFSFNTPEGRCENCKGEGFIKEELMFLPDTYTTCPVCQGKRFKDDSLQVQYKGKNIAEILEMTTEEALEFFDHKESIKRALKTISEVGLGYLKLGQPATTLSGGEAQRIKLATELQRPDKGHTLYLMDEPSTGLHPEDVLKLREEIQMLIEKKNTVIIVEHNMALAADADYLVDLGPAGGERGGKILSQGSPEEVAADPKSISGKYLTEQFNPF